MESDQMLNYVRNVDITYMYNIADNTGLLPSMSGGHYGMCVLNIPVPHANWNYAYIIIYSYAMRFLL